MLTDRMVPILCVLLNAQENVTPVKHQLTVRLYNSAHVSAGDLVQAEQRAAEIFRQAKVKIIWDLIPLAGSVRHPGKSEEWNPADLHLRLWTHDMVGTNAFSDDTLGFCLSIEQSTAIIITDEIRSRAALDFTNPGDLLGLVMAHEMGHLLLPSAAHSDGGIMQAKIATTLRDRKRMLLVFSRLQATLIQTEIQRRTGVQSARKARAAP